MEQLGGASVEYTGKLGHLFIDSPYEWILILSLGIAIIILALAISSKITKNKQ